MTNEQSIKTKRTGVYLIPIAMLVINSFLSVKYDADSAGMLVGAYFVGYLTFLVYFVSLVLVLMNQHKLLEYQKTYIDVAFAVGLINVFTSIASAVITTLLS